MADTSTLHHSKPGTACIGCRRRKLKCTREPNGCNNCLKSDLPCVYPAPETGVKRKRGPYKKDKPPRERHLEDLVKYLEPRAGQDNNAATSGSTDDARGRQRAGDGPPSNLSNSTSGALNGLVSATSPQSRTGNPEDLVKDALIALTQSSAAERDSMMDHGSTTAQTAARSSSDLGGLGLHPPMRRIFECWHLFVSRVDPLTKVIHCPTFSKVLFASIDNLQRLEPATNALLFSIYHAAVTTCTPKEARQKFNESRNTLLQKYGRSVEATLADNYGMPEMHSLQAIVLYLISIRREDNVANVRALYSLGVRMAQLMGLNQDPGESYSPLDAELRRRMWWHLCGLESRGAEEGGSRSHSIIDGTEVQLPGNVLDLDLHADDLERVKSRDGCTDMYFPLLRFEVLRMIRDLVSIRLNAKAGNQSDAQDDLKDEQRRSLDESIRRLDTQYIRHLDASRPYDWLCIGFTKTMLIKARLIIDHPFGQVPTKQMSHEERFSLLQSSVNIIAWTHNIETTGKKGAEPWLWYIRGWTQWHSLAIVIAELGQSTNKQFASYAWAVLDPILAKWDKMYTVKRDEPAWDHVNVLIERARQMRPQNASSTVTQTMQTTQTSIPVEPARDQTIVQDTAVKSAGEMAILYPHLLPPSDYIPGTGRAYLPTVRDTQPMPMQRNGQIPFQTGCAPRMDGFDVEFGDFGPIESLQDIDFSAFDAVFGDNSWDLSSSNTDWSMEPHIYDHCEI